MRKLHFFLTFFLVLNAFPASGSMKQEATEDCAQILKAPSRFLEFIEKNKDQLPEIVTTLILELHHEAKKRGVSLTTTDLYKMKVGDPRIQRHFRPLGRALTGQKILEYLIIHLYNGKKTGPEILADIIGETSSARLAKPTKPKHYKLLYQLFIEDGEVNPSTIKNLAPNDPRIIGTYGFPVDTLYAQIKETLNRRKILKYFFEAFAAPWDPNQLLLNNFDFSCFLFEILYDLNAQNKVLISNPKIYGFFILEVIQNFHQKGRAEILRNPRAHSQLIAQLVAKLILMEKQWRPPLPTISKVSKKTQKRGKTAFLFQDWTIDYTIAPANLMAYINTLILHSDEFDTLNLN